MPTIINPADYDLEPLETLLARRDCQAAREPMWMGERVRWENWVSDGHLALDLSCRRPRLRSLPAAPADDPVRPASLYLQQLIYQIIGQPTLDVEPAGWYQRSRRPADRMLIAWFRIGERWLSVNARKFAFLAHQVPYGRLVLSSKHDVLTFMRDAKPVALLMPLMRHSHDVPQLRPQPEPVVQLADAE